MFSSISTKTVLYFSVILFIVPFILSVCMSCLKYAFIL